MSACGGRYAHHIPGPGILFFGLIGLMIVGVLPWWMFFLVFFVIAPKHRMSCGASRTTIDVPKRKTHDEPFEKRKNDEPVYIRTRDGEWFEVID